MSKLDDAIFPGIDDTGEYIPLASYHPQFWAENGIWFGRHGTARRWAVCIFLHVTRVDCFNRFIIKLTDKTIHRWLACVVVGIVSMVKGITLVGIKKAFTMGFGALSLNAIAVASDYEGGSCKSILTTSLIANLLQLFSKGCTSCTMPSSQA